MPSFYFDLREGASFTPDDEGLECDSLDVAEREAAEAAAVIVRDRLPKDNGRAISVEVRNEHRQRVLTVTVSIELHQVDPRLQHPQP